MHAQRLKAILIKAWQLICTINKKFGLHIHVTVGNLWDKAKFCTHFKIPRILCQIYMCRRCEINGQSCFGRQNMHVPV